MKKNMGIVDKTVRIIPALAIISLYFLNQISGVAAIIMLVFAGVFIVTSFINVCPIYLPFGFSTKRKEA
jgi:hypothetical protein